MTAADEQSPGTIEQEFPLLLTLATMEPDPRADYEFRRGFYAAKEVIRLKAAAHRAATDPRTALEAQEIAEAPDSEELEFSWQYGWRAVFDSTGEEYDWYPTASLEEAQLVVADGAEDEQDVGSEGKLVYSVWRRRVAHGPRLPLDGTETKEEH